MLSNDQAFEVRLEPQSIKEIERFTDIVCDSLYINDTYYGNILMVLTNAFEMCLESSVSESIILSYSTDYQIVTISIKPVEDEVISRFIKAVDLDSTNDDDLLRKIFLIQSLSDDTSVEEDSISVKFDISAMHNAIYNERMKHLTSYLTRPEKKVSQKENDKFQ